MKITEDYASFPLFMLVTAGAASGAFAFCVLEEDPIWRAAIAAFTVLNFLLAIWESGKARR